MYCRNCGAKLSDDSAFCGDCGAKVIKINPTGAPNSKETPIYNPVYNSVVNVPAVRKQSKGNRKIIFLITGLAVVCLIAVFIFTKVFILNNSESVAQNSEGSVTQKSEKSDIRKGDEAIYTLDAEALAKKSVDALYTGDMETIYDLIPDTVMDYLLTLDINTREEYIEYWKDSFTAIYGVSPKIDYDISSIEDLSENELGPINYNYKSYDITVSDAKRVTVNFTYEDSDGNMQTDCGKIILVKIDGKWYYDLLDSETIHNE